MSRHPFTNAQYVSRRLTTPCTFRLTIPPGDSAQMVVPRMGRERITEPCSHTSEVSNEPPRRADEDEPATVEPIFSH